MVSSGAPPASAAVFPTGFADSLVASVGRPTALAFTPDGRLLVTAAPGQLLVVRGSTVGSPAALDLSARVCSNGERGLLGVAVDPAFATNGFVYLYYTSENSDGACPTKETNLPVNRVSRFVLGSDDVVDPASETVLFDKIPSVAGNHNAGDVAFGSDGMLYVSVGDGGCDYDDFAACGGANAAARDTHVALGKILRISPADGSAPAGNPFLGTQPPCRDDGVTTVGQHCPETFAWGFRNPFRMAFSPDGRLHVNDVGQGAWEEIDVAQAGLDYGWNLREGKCVTGSTTNCPDPPTGLTDPVLAYGRSDGCRSITGGAFAPESWPEAFRGDYLFADYVCGRIFRMEGTSRVDFVTALGANSAVHLELGPDDALYYTTYASGGQVRRIAYAPTPPAGDVYVSDLTPTAATNGLGPIERNMSNGDAAAGDGGPITLNGVVSARGLGAHAVANVTYAVPSGALAFAAEVGIDDECGSAGSVTFQVFVDGVKRFDSRLMTGASPTRSVNVDVSGASQVVLRVTNGGDGKACDHADWADARFVRGAPTSTSAPPTTTTTAAPPTTTTVAPPTTTTTVAPPPERYLSDLTPSAATNGFGPIERDMSVGGAAAGDGRPIQLNGVTSAKGLGVHATSSVTYTVPAGATAFVSDVGIDDECGSSGSVVFQVFVNGTKRYDSGLMRGTTVTKTASVPVAVGNTLQLKVTNGGDGTACDHADWAMARLT
jgi:glucose/arabinose dehydrogenase